MRATPVQPLDDSSPLREGPLNALVLADSKGDVAQAAKILVGAVRPAPFKTTAAPWAHHAVATRH